MNSILMTAQITAGLLASPMFIPGWRTPLLPAGLFHGGIPLAIYSLSTGLYMVIDPPATLSTTMAAGDWVELWVNGQPTGVIVIIKVGEENDRIAITLPWGWLVNGANTLFYRLNRFSGNFVDSKPVLDLLFNNPAPTITITHPASIGPGQLAVITITIGYARPHDTITVTIGTWTITFTNPDPTKPIIHNLTAADLLQIGDGTHSVSGIARDQLANTGLSATTSITITANQQLIVPTLTNVLDQNNNEVPPNATTPSTTLTLKGKAHPLQQVEIYDGSGPSAVPKGIETATLNGDWLRTITVPVGPRRLYAKSRYHPTNIYSNVRLLTVEVDVVVAFLNAPYSATAGAQVTGIELVVTEAGKPAAGKIVTVTLPQGSTFPGDSNEGIFTTDANGKIALTGVTAGSGVGAFSIEAVSGGSTASAALTIVAQIPVGTIFLNDNPYGIAIRPDGKSACVLCSYSLYEIDVASATVRRSKTQIKQGLGEVAYSPDGTCIYLCQSQAVSVVDARTLLTIAEIPIIGTPLGIVLNEDGSQAYVTTWDGDSVQVLDLVNQVVVSTILVGRYPRGIALSPDGALLYVCNYGIVTPGSVSIININTLAVIRTITTNIGAYDVAVSPGGDSIFVCGSNNTQSFVLQFDGLTWTQTRTISVTPGVKCLALNHSGTEVYCTGLTTDIVTTIATQSGQVIGTTAVGSEPIMVAITGDDTRGLVICRVSKTVEVIALLPSA
ncbi:cytochrome D1 domain-containing protein [Pseudomonas sp. TWP3-1]|uniref:YncE family protein n=1 Tax=Pseudomonas sp. TWP3-1 TaxID=2804631 RepID=UPI003CF090B6